MVWSGHVVVARFVRDEGYPVGQNVGASIKFMVEPVPSLFASVIRSCTR